MNYWKCNCSTPAELSGPFAANPPTATCSGCGKPVGRDLSKESNNLQLPITLLACLGEMSAVIKRDAGTRYSGASIDVAYEALWREFEKCAPPGEAAAQDALHPRHIATWLAKP